MREEVLQAVIDRASIDSDFEQLLHTRPGKALSSMGVTQGEWEALHSLDETQPTSTAKQVSIVSLMATQLLGVDCGCDYTPSNRINYCTEVR